MAKKPSSDATTTWISLSDAKKLVVMAHDGAEQLAERRLVKWLGESKVRWRCKLFEGPSTSQRKAAEAAAAGVDYGSAPVIACSEGDAAFWHTAIKINWQENSAIGGACAYGIRVAHEDVLALLPEEPGERKEATATSKGWIVEEARRMKWAGEIPDGIRKTDFAKLLEKQMNKAVNAGRAKKSVSWRHIKNHLKAWDRWPISSIK